MSGRVLDGIGSPRDLAGLSVDQLVTLAAEMRRDIIEVAHRNGGHLGSNLGVVELAIGLHRTFDFSQDSLIWDVSHQAYPHKILTGRAKQFSTIRKHKGLSGFTNPKESPYDLFMLGHAGTATSLALGMAAADKLKGRARRTVSVVGDGSMTCGVAYEALNHAGGLGLNLLVVLNDNKMSISKTVGALSNYLNKVRTSHLYNEAKDELRRFLDKIPTLGQPTEVVLERVRTMLKSPLGGSLFEELGFHYYGPIDGHSIPVLLETLTDIQRISGPVLLHIVTEKGKGYVHETVEDPCGYHSPPATLPKGFSDKVAPTAWAAVPAPVVNLATSGCLIEPVVPPPPAGVPAKPVKPSFTKVFARHLTALGKKNPAVVALTAAMADGTGLAAYAKELPDRYFDVGICEQHAVGMAAGLAKAGMRPVVAIYSTFLQRAYDQVFQEVTVQGLPVVFAMDRGGIVGADGPTHHGVFDIAFLRCFPGMTCMAPKDGHELGLMLEHALNISGPSCLRYPRADVTDREAVVDRSGPVRHGRAETLRKGADAVLIGYGVMTYDALDAADLLAAQGIHVTVVNGRFAKPIDAEMVRDAVLGHPLVVTIEDHVLAGGFGAAVIESAMAQGLDLNRIRCLAVPDELVEHGGREALMRQIGLDAGSIAARTAAALAEIRAGRTGAPAGGRWA